jgi:hypothetical protein
LPTIVILLVEVECTRLFVTNVEKWLHREEVEGFDRLLFVVIHLKLIGEIAVVEMWLEADEKIALDDRILVPALRISFDVLEALLNSFCVGKDELEVDDLDVAKWIDTSSHVVNITILKDTDDFGNHVGLADVGEELVPKAFATGGTLYEASDVDELDDGWEDLL